MECIEAVRSVLPRAVVEVRMDSAFFGEQIITALDECAVEYSISVPVERYQAIREQIDERERWRRIDSMHGYFERPWQMKSWTIDPHRFVFIRRRTRLPHKGPIQLDMFLPRDYRYEYKVIVTNKSTGARSVMAFHDGRGSQEGLFAELKSHGQLDYIPANTWNANKVYLLASVLAHNLSRELQMRHLKHQRSTLAKRPALWQFTRLDTLRLKAIEAGTSLRTASGLDSNEW